MPPRATIYIAGQKPGVFTRILLTVATLGLVVVGFFFFTVALVVGAILALVIGARLWWVLRKLKRAAAASAQSPYTQADRSGKDTLDGEYQVVERDSSAEKLPPNGKA